ncbi:MAG: biopolymer transporter ExbD [Mariniblastus sp.]|nr:biopolymer transporter ExbD [Mariniblastus sp.]
MKLSNRNFSSRRPTLSMTSMIDVVFLLLIFFIVSTTFVKPDRDIAAAIEVNEQKSAANQSNLEPAIVDVFRRESQTWFRVGAIETDNLDKIKILLKGFDNKSEGAFVRAADNVPYEAAAQAIGICRESGFKSVSYLPF